ncbi:MAG: hypothetical protein H6581_02205 [Bacteroidia bacterium]|nr:hypothetical protein [Bacteroidia bacterium]
MAKMFNKNDVLRFLYDEMDPAEQELFLDQLCEDEELWATFEELKESKEKLEPEVRLEQPSPLSVQKVLNFARHSAIYSPIPTGVSGQRSVPLHVVLSVIMIICTFITMGVGVYAYRQQPGESIYTDETTQVQWDNSHLHRRIQKVKMNVQNLSSERQMALPLYHNTYRLVNTAQFSPASANVVLVNLK